MSVVLLCLTLLGAYQLGRIIVGVIVVLCRACGWRVE